MTNTQPRANPSACSYANALKPTEGYRRKVFEKKIVDNEPLYFMELHGNFVLNPYSLLTHETIVMNQSDLSHPSNSHLTVMLLTN